MPASTRKRAKRDRHAISPQYREPNGRLQRLTTLPERERKMQDEAMATALAQPHRTGLPTTYLDDQGKRQTVQRRDDRGGYELGRMRLRGEITDAQLAAGNRYTELALRHMRVVTGSLPRFPCQAINDVATGISLAPDLDDEAVFNLRRSWEDAQRALADTNEWKACNSALASICIMDREVRDHAEGGALRVALNTLSRLWA